MSSFFLILTIVTMVAVLITLIVGIVSMTTGGEFNKKYGNKLMRVRVILQGIALLFFGLYLAGKQ